MGDPIIYIGIAFTLLAAGALIGYGMAILQVIHQLENEIEALQDEIKKIMKEIRDDESGFGGQSISDHNAGHGGH